MRRIPRPCSPDRTRTCNLLLRRQLLYPIELRNYIGTQPLIAGVGPNAASQGFEPQFCGSKPHELPLFDKASVPPNGNAPLSLRLQLSALLLCYEGVGSVGLAPTLFRV